MMQMKTKIAPVFRPSFTLIELLVAIAIIGVMTGMVLFSLAGAQRDALTARTRSTISKINDVILQEWEKFRYRSVRIDVPTEWLRPSVNSATGLLGQPPLSPREASRLRMIVLRDTMRMEMPDRMNDILYPPTLYVTAGFTANNPGNTMDDVSYTVVSRAVPGKLNNYRAKFGLPAFSSPYSVPGVPATAFSNPLYQSAECLYQIVAAANFQSGSALELFRPTEISDVDGDGFPEFIDAWGTPISWIRWPSGFDSPLNDTSAADPMDPLRVDWRHSNAYQPAFAVKPWLLVPLVVSAGPDGIFELFNPDGITYATQTWDPQFLTGSAVHFSDPSIGRNVYYFPDPYVGSYDNNGMWTGTLAKPHGDGLGYREGVGADDNITNYQLILE
jgi:prepilin-type N-terminal cleavage/methylation domain-containing protein